MTVASMDELLMLELTMLLELLVLEVAGLLEDWTKEDAATLLKLEDEGDGIIELEDDWTVEVDCEMLSLEERAMLTTGVET